MTRSKPTCVHELDVEIEDWSALGRADVTWRTLISADRTPTDSITMGIAELAPGRTGEPRLHRHEPAELYYILSGTGFVAVGDQRFDVRTGSTVFIPGNALHAAANTGEIVMRILYVFGVDSFGDVEYVFES
jgi:mannose-6-phosphate isomerase-like protein (cupin superfamily)